jgi:pimeloyl-ACP methyl ester carboxylesterase
LGGIAVRVVSIILVILIVAVAAIGLVLALTPPKAPPPLASIEDALDHVDFSDMPPKSHFVARDGTRLDYRAYPGDPSEVVVLVHGSSGTSASMHVLARAIHQDGATVYALAMRGHDGTGRSGDIDYIGQLDDDLVDFVKTLPPKPANGWRTLLGFSSGGGFVLRVAGTPNGRLFDRFVLVSPQMPARSPMMRPNAGGWVGVSIPRIVILSFLSRAGIHALDGLDAIAFAVSPEGRRVQTAVYSYRMLVTFGPSADYLGDLHRAPGPVSIFAGANDELFYTDKYSAATKPVRPDVDITLVPGMGHMDMTLKPTALTAIRQRIYAR